MLNVVYLIFNVKSVSHYLSFIGLVILQYASTYKSYYHRSNRYGG